MSQGSHSNYFVHTLLRARDWQHRPQFDEVCNWWREGGRGVCALVGMGGAGKTAIAERFLNELLGNTSSTRKRVNPPNSAFVYSFYDDDKPENFFRHLQIWLEGTSAPDKQKSPTQLMFDIQQHQGLIILDGLERVQESGARGGFGRLTSPSLRDLLNHIASGSARELSVLVTSRCPLTDLRDNDPRYFHTIPIDQIEPEAGIALLRSRGIRGTDMQLAPIVEHCGRHALTIDLAGGFIKEYGNGDPSTPLNLGTAEELQADAEQEPDDARRAVLKQGIRFARIAQRYREAMLNSDEAALALLERICLFRLGVDCQTLAAIFTGLDAENVSGKALASLDAGQLQKKLDWLVRMRIVLKSKPSIYTIHPAVRDGFLSTLTTHTARKGHEAVREGLERVLESRQGRYYAPTFFPPLYFGGLGGQPSDRHPSDSATLDLLEEIIYHAVVNGNLIDAWRIYVNRIGGHANLGKRLGEFERGERICRLFCNELDKRDSLDSLDDIPTRSRTDWGKYFLGLGFLDNARSCFEAATLESIMMFADIQIASGNLRTGIESIDLAVKLANAETKVEERSYALYRTYVAKGQLLLLRGEIPTLRVTRRGIHIEKKTYFDADEHGGTLPDDEFKLDILTRFYFGSLDEDALGKVLTAIHFVESETLGGTISDYDDTCYHLALAELVHDRKSLEKSHDWAVAHNAKEVLCWSYLVQSRLVLSPFAYQKAAHGHRAEHLATADASITAGLKIARDCGYGVYHINLLLERARLHMLRGDAEGALAYIKVALETGIRADEVTGKAELLAARHDECGYVWAIPVGLQFRAEALLLRAAQELGSDSFVPAKINDLPHNIVKLIKRAIQLLHEAFDLWQPLHDPKPERDDQNFKLDGKEYNYRAAETHKVIVDLQAGLLTRYPLEMKENPMNERGLGYGDDTDDEDKSPPQYSETVNVEPVAGKLKILFLAANPEGTTRLKLAEEFRNIQDRIRECKFRDRMELTIRQAVRHGDLALALMEEKPHIVHFSGHGSDRDELILQDQQGNPHSVSRNALVALVKTLKDDIRLIVFNACYSKPQSEGIVENIAFAIGMKQAIGDKAAIQFAESLYQGIGFGRTLQEAFDLGTIALQLAGIGEELTPQLLNHPKANPEVTKLIDVDQQQAAQQKVDNNTMSKYSGAVDLWQEKLKRLQEALATEDDVTRKLRYEKQIEECNQKIQELTANPQ